MMNQIQSSSRLELQEQQQHIHVVSMSKQAVRDIHELILQEGKEREWGRKREEAIVMTLCGDDDFRSKEEAVQKWVNGEARIFISTTAGSVGIDSSHATFQVVAEGMYDLVCLIQAHGRVRGSGTGLLVIDVQRMQMLQRFNQTQQEAKRMLLQTYMECLSNGLSS